MPAWAKMASNLDSNPKIRKAGRAAREVFLFVLRRNADLDLGGRVPELHVEPWHLADQLMMSEDEARDGLSRSVTAGLLRRDRGFYVIQGWDDQWAKRPLSDLERKRKQRSKPALHKPVSHKVTNGHDANVTSVTVTDQRRSEKRRGDQSREEKNIPPAPRAVVKAPPGEEAISAADRLRDEIVAQHPNHKLAHAWTPATRLKWAEEFQRLNARDHREWADIAATVHWLFHEQTEQYRFVVQSPSALAEKWDRIAERRHRPRIQNQSGLDVALAIARGEA